MILFNKESSADYEDCADTVFGLWVSVFEFAVFNFHFSFFSFSRQLLPSAFCFLLSNLSNLRNLWMILPAPPLFDELLLEVTVSSGLDLRAGPFDLAREGWNAQAFQRLINDFSFDVR